MYIPFAFAFFFSFPTLKIIQVNIIKNIKHIILRICGCRFHPIVSQFRTQNIETIKSGHTCLDVVFVHINRKKTFALLLDTT